MGRLDEIVSEQYARWVERGQGWKVWPYPVLPEPPFRPFVGFRFPRPNVEEDDGRKRGLLASLLDLAHQKLNPKPPLIPELEQEEPEAEPFAREELVELQTILPSNLDIKPEVFADFLSQLAVCQEPIAFELLGTAGRIAVQFVAHPKDVPILKRQLAGHFPEAAFISAESGLVNAWMESQDESLIVEFGLEQEFLLPLTTGRKLDPFVGLLGAMRELRSGELALFQVIFHAAEHNWQESAMRIVTDAQDKAIFVNRPELVEQAKQKLTSHLHAAIVRIAVKAGDQERPTDIARELAFALRTFENREGNALIPLYNKDYPPDDHEEDVLLRQCRRNGMLLNTEELMGFAHFPSSAVRAPELMRQSGCTQAAPECVTENDRYVLGHNVHLGRSVPVGLKPEQRTRHIHVIGTPGTGKSNFIFNLICQDIEHGEGLAVIDPHGDLIEKILGCIPEHRVSDVVLVDMADEEYSIPFNILSAPSESEKRLIASDLTAVFQRLSTSWGDQMTSVLNNAVLAFLESSQGGTLVEMRRFLIEPAFRNQFLRSVKEPNVVYYWQKVFPQLIGNKSIGPLVTRLDLLLAKKPISHMVEQKENRLDFSAMMNEGKIFLAKLPQGEIGYENSCLMGSLLMAKLHLAAMGRQSIPEAARRHFYIYLDEAHNFATPSMVEILTGARKYRVGLVLAHQELGQLERMKEIAGAIMGCHTRVAFHVTDNDARKLSEGFAHFEASDLLNLKQGEAICKVERADYDFNLSIPFSEPGNPVQATVREVVIQSSRSKYGTLRSEVEEALRRSLPHDEPPKPVVPAKSVTPPSPPPSPPPLPKIAEPKSSEIQNQTVSEKQDSATQTREEPKPAPNLQLEESLEVKEPKTEPRKTQELLLSRALGRGGAEHKALQRQIKETGETLGFIGSIEKQILGGRGSVDILLERKDMAIACEIAMTTTVDDEIKNILKCVQAGYQNINVIATDLRHLEKIQAQVMQNLSSEAGKRVSFYQLDAFLSHLKSLPLPPPAPAGPRIRRGRKVTYSISSLSPEQQKQKDAERIRSIAEAMQGRKHKKKGSN